MNYVIIGNGTAAIGVIEGIRVVDKHSPITVISDEVYPVYGRPLISYLLLGETTEQRMLRYRPADFYEKNNVKTLFGRTALSINTAGKTVSLEGGESVPYDKLCICTGSRPFVPPMEGLETVKNKTSFMTLDDAKRLDALLGDKNDKRVLIIDGEPVPYALARIPQAGEVRGNLAAGGRGVAQPLSDQDRDTARAIGSVLAPRGLLLIGLDIIGSSVTEINVTSPTCFQEIEQQTDCRVSALFINALERRVQQH